MRKVKPILLACALVCAASVSAQFTTGGKSNSLSSNTSDISAYNQIGISYVNESFNFDFPKDYHMEDIGTNGFGLKYIHGFSVSKNLPMFVETGVNFNFNFGSNESGDEDYTETLKFQWASLSVPVNFAYKFNVGENLAIKPYLGLNVKFNVLGRQKKEYGGDDDDWYDDDDWDYWSSYDYDYDYDYDYEGNNDKWANLFDKKDMGGKDQVWNRFQLGWHVGADLQYSKFFVGISYGTDFIKAYKYKKLGVNTGTLNVTLGLCF